MPERKLNYDGSGFDTSRIDPPRSGGIGLRNMRERIEHHGGKLAVSSVPGHTELSAMLPCPNAKSRAERQGGAQDFSPRAAR